MTKSLIEKFERLMNDAENKPSLKETKNIKEIKEYKNLASSSVDEILSLCGKIEACDREVYGQNFWSVFTYLLYYASIKSTNPTGTADQVEAICSVLNEDQKQALIREMKEDLEYRERKKKSRDDLKAENIEKLKRQTTLDTLKLCFHSTNFTRLGEPEVIDVPIKNYEVLKPILLYPVYIDGQDVSITERAKLKFPKLDTWLYNNVILANEWGLMDICR